MLSARYNWLVIVSYMQNMKVLTVWRVGLVTLTHFNLVSVLHQNIKVD